jgi:hypothetical protein
MTLITEICVQNIFIRLFQQHFLQTVQFVPCTRSFVNQLETVHAHFIDIFYKLLANSFRATIFLQCCTYNNNFFNYNIRN